MLDTIRQLTTTLKLKDLIISNFIPEDLSRNIEKRAQFNQEEDSWMIPVGIFFFLLLYLLLLHAFVKTPVCEKCSAEIFVVVSSCCVTPL